MIVRPNPLKSGDRVAIIATAKCIEEDSIEKAIDIFQQWGLEVKLGKHLFASCDIFAGGDDERASDLQKAIDDRTIRAIFCVRGGYGTTRIIDQVNFAKLKDDPKWIVGFSDVTALLSHLHNYNVETIHGIMPALFSQKGVSRSIESLRQILFGEYVEYTIDPCSGNRRGESSGLLIGGNLSLLCHLLGTSSDIDTDGKILFIEDVDEHLYHIDRMIIQLKRAGKLDELSGLIVGHFTDIKDDEKTPFGKNAYQIIAEHVREYSYPVCFGFPAGHLPMNKALPISRNAQLVVDKFGGVLTFKDLRV